MRPETEREPIDTARVVLEFRRRFRRTGTAERAKAERAYLKSSLQFHGVTMPDMRRACSEFCRRQGSIDRNDLRALVDALYATDYHDLRSMGLLLLEKRRDALSARDLPWLIGIVRASRNWAHVDLLATKVIGHVIARTPKASSILRSWARDEDMWVRRTALLAQHDALRAGGGDFALFARLAAPLLVEKEFFIRKAIGWVLREVSKKRPALVYDFLARHRGRVSGLTLREGSKYLSTSMRARLRRSLPIRTPG